MKRFSEQSSFCGYRWNNEMKKQVASSVKQTDRKQRPRFALFDKGVTAKQILDQPQLGKKK
jgi:hypothetical protein